MLWGKYPYNALHRVPSGLPFSVALFNYSVVRNYCLTFCCPLTCHSIRPSRSRRSPALLIYTYHLAVVVGEFVLLEKEGCSVHYGVVFFMATHLSSTIQSSDDQGEKKDRRASIIASLRITTLQELQYNSKRVHAQLINVRYVHTRRTKVSRRRRGTCRHVHDNL